MLLKQVFNMTTRIHSRSATLKRFGTPDLYSPIRITPANYFRFLEGPSQTVIRGREFIIPIDTMIGTARQKFTFAATPTAGNYILHFGGLDTAAIPFDSNAAAVQTALRLLAPLAAVTVTGDLASGFTVVFLGVDTPALLTATYDMDFTTTIAVTFVASQKWSPVIKRADKIIDPNLGHMAIDEIIEMVDLGGEVMGYRCRCE